MDLKKELKQYKSIINFKSLKKYVDRPKAIFPEKILSIIPSIRSGSDGPYFERLFLISDSFMCDINVGTSGEEFDFVALKSITNYRITISEHRVKDANEKEIKYQAASITLYHNIGIDFLTIIQYIGDNREEWLDNLFKALPIDNILKS